MIDDIELGKESAEQLRAIIAAMRKVSHAQSQPEPIALALEGDDLRDFKRERKSQANRAAANPKLTNDELLAIEQQRANGTPWRDIYEALPEEKRPAGELVGLRTMYYIRIGKAHEYAERDRRFAQKYGTDPLTTAKGRH
jgi:hypothetical protein